MSRQFSKDELEGIIRQYSPIISFTIRKALGHQYPDWEDLVQEVLTQVISKLQKGEFRGECSLGTFIYTITKRRIIDCLRQKSKASIEKIGEVASFANPEDDLLKKERAEIISRALFKLKPKFREILYLYYFKELSREEVAARLGLSVRQVSERLYYAQKVLARSLRKFFPEKNSNFSSVERLKK